MFRNENAVNIQDPIPDDTEFDIIVVGSGNGACGFLSEIQKYKHNDNLKILVLEEGHNYFYTSDVTHQNGWSKTYASGDIFKLHNAVTPDGRSILAGRARTMGGGGSINYTMIHESSEWLTKQVGHDIGYWNTCKVELNGLFERPNPFEVGYQTPFAKYIIENNVNAGYAPPTEKHMTKNIPSLTESPFGDKNSKQVYIFPTQFNQFGQRTHSGVSLVEWNKVDLRWNRRVTELQMEKSTCTGVKVLNIDTGKEITYQVKKGTGKVILCGGSQSPRLLMNTEVLAKSNDKIGKRVNDHICMPLGIYLVDKKKISVVGPTDNYQSLFSTEIIPGSTNGVGDANVVNIDYFSGEGWKSIGDKIADIKITTSLVKFNATREGYYEMKDNKIILQFFDDEQDTITAEKAINDNIDLLESNGVKPPFLVRFLIQLVTKIPYKKGRQVKEFVKHFADKTLLSEQHLAGGCIFGDVIDKGLNDSASTGKVFGSDNIHVADLSAVPLPRVSTQMTAYLMGHHVAKQLYNTKKKN
ncbi:FAD/NAD(P)-binding domain-containing protein [Fragilariopsis cylindrus CCMP1102]|uniref:FAD/NAD(P)-binding domain-containing protein n=1 Tax=Fragilariopsis cylindrus CCMP1102 TaxID=635003 RepID=A0A1E7F6X9_9STRA|nr:FAD/NAD(P)-binding domain-containing protein [Fragilariopsis cylindrus CCMP1102]|eukprot:OEU13942.1 FAD/NAD(P)-binding domain-containing protein [Fragilariopsis cylindrus CCMP1102]